MRKILTVALCLFATTAWAEDAWYRVNQITVAWDAVTEMDDGQGNLSPIPEGDTVEYQVAIRPSTMGEDAAILVGVTRETQFTVSVPEGRWYIGAQTVRIPAGQTEQQRSTISWSDRSADVYNAETFGAYLFFSPAPVRGLRLVP